MTGEAYVISVELSLGAVGTISKAKKASGRIKIVTIVGEIYRIKIIISGSESELPVDGFISFISDFRISENTLRGKTWAKCRSKCSHIIVIGIIPLIDKH